MLGRDNKIEIIGSRGEFEEAIDENGSHNWPGSSFPRHPFEFYEFITQRETLEIKEGFRFNPLRWLKIFSNFTPVFERIGNYLLISFFLERKKRKKKNKKLILAWEILVQSSR